MVYPLCCSSGSSRECVGVPHYAPEQPGKTQPRRQQELLLLFFREQLNDETVQNDLLIPGNAGDQMVRHMAGLAPRSAADQQREETRTETARAAFIFEGHQI